MFEWHEFGNMDDFGRGGGGEPGEQERLRHEWHRFEYVAIDVEPGRDIEGLLELLQRRAAEGQLQFEMAE